MKPVHVRWVISLYDKFRNNPKIIIKAFDMAFVTKALQMDNLDADDPFSGCRNNFKRVNRISKHYLSQFTVFLCCYDGVRNLKQFVRNKGHKSSEINLPENTLSEFFGSEIF